MDVSIILWFRMLYYCVVWLVGSSLLKEVAASILKVGVNKVVMVVGCIVIGERGSFVCEE
jgi:hypothetical protein